MAGIQYVVFVSPSAIHHKYTMTDTQTLSKFNSGPDYRVESI